MNEKLSIITVCLNDSKNLEKTIENLKNQEYRFEYIIVDGGSVDHAEKIFTQNKEIIDHLIIEEDKGIYDAMNKGISIASGEWILFLNAGDLLENDQVLKSIFSRDDQHKDIDIIFGDTMVMKNNKEIRLIKAGNLENLYYGMQFSHQSMLVRTSLQKLFLFNIDYKFGADFDFIINAFITRKNFFRYNGPIAKIELGGVSDIERIKVLNEWLRIIKKKSFKGSIIMIIKIFVQFVKKIIKFNIK